MTDAEYQDKLQIAVMTAIVAASHNEALGAPVLRTGEIIAAMTVTMAGVLAFSPETASPTKARRMAEHVAKRLTKNIVAIRESGGFTFPHILVDAGTLHAASPTATSH